MSLITVTSQGKYTVRYFLGNEEDVEQLASSFNGLVSLEVVTVPQVLVDYMYTLEYSPEPPPPSEEVVALVAGCPIDIARLAKHIDWDGSDSVDTDGQGYASGNAQYEIPLYKGIYTVPPTLLELALISADSDSHSHNEPGLGPVFSRARRRTGYVK